MNKRVLVTGADGMLAKDITSVFVETGEYDVFGVDIRQGNEYHRQLSSFYCGDLTDHRVLDVILDEVKPEVIIHTAAIVNVNSCQENPTAANKLHIDASRRLAEYGARMVYISTDSVFNGKRGNYTEIDVPDPLNLYAASKLLGEFAVEAANSMSLVVRTNIYGYNRPMRSSLAEWGLQNLLQGLAINGYEDIYFNAIYTYHLAEVVLELCTLELSGCYNVASINSVSKYEFLCLLAAEFGLDAALVKPSKSDDHAGSGPPRPLNSSLDVRKVLQYASLPTVEEGIRAFRDHYRRDPGYS